jgi:(S)-2-hydroxy-acid oxidase
LQILTPLTAAGYKAIWLSVDVPMLGRRLNEYRNDFTIPENLAWPNLLSTGKAELSGITNESQDYEFGIRCYYVCT